MHEEKGVLMAHHQFAHSCQKQGNSCQKQGGFHSFENAKNESLSHYHDRAKFLYNCVKLMWMTTAVLSL